MSEASHPLTFIDPVCGKPGFHRVRVPVPTDLIMARDFEHVDGRPAMSHDPMVCDSCKRPLWDPAALRAMLDPANYKPR